MSPVAQKGRRMSLRAAGLVCVAGLVCGACVSSYDPSGPPRLGLGERAPGMQRPRAAPGAVLVTTPAPVPAAPAGPRWSGTLPASPAGEQMAWFMSALDGTVNLKRIERRFAPGFLAQAPIERVRTAIRHWRRDELANARVRLYRAIEEEPGRLVAILQPVGARAEEAAYTQVWMSVDGRGRIESLRLAPAVDVDAVEINTWERLDARLAALPGLVSLAAVDLAAGAPVHGRSAEARMAIGSASRVFILGALAEMVAAGEASWEQPLAVRDDLKSLPPGRMQLEDEGDEFPLARYAELMVTLGDNTASDHLLAFLGRERVESFMARHTSADERNTPFLSRMEALSLAHGADPALAGRFLSADEAAQRAMVAPGGEVDAAAPAPEAAGGATRPIELGRIGWFASAGELAGVMATLQRLESRPGMEPLRAMLRVHRGLAFDPAVWPGVVFVGASEPGLQAATWVLTRADGRVFALSLVWNHEQGSLDRRSLAEMAGAAVGLLAREGRPR
jgi:hypothetical protein